MIRYIFSTAREKYEFMKVAELAPRGEMSVIDEVPTDGRDEVWVHVGYCRGDGVGIGVLIEPSYVYDGDSGEMIKIEPLFPLEHRVCVSEKNSGMKFNCPVVYDDRLFEIAEKKRRGLFAIKIVSKGVDGSVNHGKDGAWIRAAELLLKYLREK